LIGFFGVTRDAVEERPQELCRPQTHVLEGLIDEQLVQRELICRNILESSRVGFDAFRDLRGWTNVRDEPDAMRRLRVDCISAQQELFCMLQAEPVHPHHRRRCPKNTRRGRIR
jgi:hypothetical protein